MNEKWTTIEVGHSGEVKQFIDGVPLEEYRQNLVNAQIFLPDLLEAIAKHNLSEKQIQKVLRQMIDSGRKASFILEARG